ncbi:Transposase [compost metagenome]|uniref:Transposase n=2 Tax=Paenibacillus sonchi TaxID=373687 RepID=A0A974PH70_9BACL|nr:transposase [Paenibacillus sonchi]QQZ58571.1 transposase [Paenibacillus sonchi]QQZ63180.1 transposase [Paenibacillus sonchi]QQZ63736.1 transposase [Paenibacillus sonchi]
MVERKRYNKEFKEETVKYIQEQRKSMDEIALELNIPKGTLKDWMMKFRQFPNEPFVGSGKLRAQEQQIADLEQKNKDLEEEVAILKKAMHIFSKDRD